MTNGEALGVELGTIYEYGRVTLPQLSTEYDQAWMFTPTAVGAITARGGGLGMDPGAKFDSLLDVLNKATAQTRDVLTEVAQRLVWAADDYHGADSAAERVFNAQKRKADAEAGS